MKEVEWWVLYPYYGVKLESEVHGLDKPLFPDFTVVSRARIPDLAACLKPPVLFHSADNLSADFETFLAIRTTEREEIFDNTKDNAELFGAIIALATYSTNMCFSSSLLEKLSMTNSENRLAADILNGRSSFARWMERRGVRTVCYQPNCFSHTWDSLRALLLSPDLGFGCLLLEPSESISDSLKGRLRTAVLILDEAMRQKDYSLQVLGCMTVMECLFKKNTDYTTFTKRIPKILGTYTCFHLHFQSVLDSRHDFVHKGVKLHEQALTYSALPLALASLVAYSNLAPHYTSWELMMKAIDHLEAGKTVLQDRIAVGFDKISRIENIKHFVTRDLTEEEILAANSWE